MAKEITLINLNSPVRYIDPEDNPYNIYIDYPPQFDEYRMQKILVDVQAAITFIFRSFYGDYRLLPQIQGLFVDIQRYKHILDSDLNRTKINTMVNAALSDMLKDMSPTIDIGYDPNTSKMTYSITLRSDVKISVDNAESPLYAEIKLNNKKFYD